VTVCPDCGYEFPLPDRNKHEANAANEGILTGEIVDTEYDVDDVFYNVHTKKVNRPTGGGLSNAEGYRDGTARSPQTFRIDYQVGLKEYKSEWVCPEHSGWARRKFEKWWKERSHDPVPDSAVLAVRIAKAGGLADTKSIVVRKVGGEKFDRIIRYSLDEKPHSVSENFDDEETKQSEEYNDPFDEGMFDSDDVPF
jgi:DNA repair protein RadD